MNYPKNELKVKLMLEMYRIGEKFFLKVKDLENIKIDKNKNSYFKSTLHGNKKFYFDKENKNIFYENHMETNYVT